ncbi:hypothetical protein [Pleionea litopenaei]|uniref:DUF4124 domain-containing protein n=1 Tax=Pleionea litopenaei TaxID=3070815 RepID=A0AA51RQD4_9GAMM|nr:hypothetical protein [Pleionea sp. HL-JVS1]WMS85711.1 hypothetical protein Q9312_10845 [Pleionea sp. HL-JVS1]
MIVTAKTFNKPLALLTVLLVTFSLSVSAKSYYRYKNDEGQVILVDQLTPEAIAVGYDVINEQGQLVQRVPPGKTLAELEQDKQRIIEEKRKEKERQRQLRRDAELLRLFSSAEDIQRARDAALLGVDQRLEINNGEQALLKNQLEDYQRRAANFERMGKPVPKILKDSIDGVQKQIVDRDRTRTLIETEREKVKQDFEKDLIRFKELHAQRMALKYQNKGNNGSADANLMIVTCTSNQQCNDMWKLAQVYAQRNASGRLEIVTDTIILTSAPKQDSEVGLSFSRLPGKTETQIILEITCNNTEAGESLCKSSEARKLSQGFKDFVEGQLSS